MCIAPDMEIVDTMILSGDGASVIINGSHTIPLVNLNFQIAEELGRLTLQNSGADTLWCDSWPHIQELTNQLGCTLPFWVSPCRNCDGSRCRDCDQHN